jgi:hypothetical protein
MKRAWWVGVVVAASVLAVPPAVAQDTKPAPGPAAGTSSVQKLRVKKVTLGIGHRAFSEFYDEVSVRVGEEFGVGSTNYTARVLRFEPDFFVDMDTRQIASKSNRPDNPAFQIATIENGAPHDTSWAFLNFPPHFSKRALLAFKVLRIEFENHAPVTAKAKPGMPAGAGGAKAGKGAKDAPADSAGRGAKR